MATNSNNNGGNGQRPAGSGRKPSGSAQRPTGQRPAGSGQRPAGSGQRTGAANGQKRMSAKQRAAKKRKKVIIFGIEIVVILFMVALLYLVMTHTNNEGPKVTVLETEELQIPEEVQQDETMKGYMNIALFGVDATKESLLYKGSRSDSIMIASINMDTGDIKLVSVYRDTYLNTGTDSYQKCNAAYSYGGAEQAVKMLNMNLDMDITNFVHINNYQIGIAEVLKCDYTPVTETGMQLLNGLQATAYCRIRYTAGNDFKRAARQREVIQAIEDQAKKADYATLSKVFNSAIDDIYTSLDSKDILDLLGNISNYRIVDEGGFPEETMRDTGNIGAKGSCVIPVNLESNVVWLHQFLFDDANYSVTSNVKEYSNKIESDTSPYMNK